MLEWEAELGDSRLLFGEGALERLGELSASLGARRALIVCDPGLRRAGHADRAEASLEAHGIASSIYDGVESNPTTEHVRLGAERARDIDADFLVGLGGGSAMDCAKGVNFLVTQGGRMEDYQGRGTAHGPMLPSIGVPTTAGTGSEAQSFALISRADTNEKMACGDPRARFRAVILDPTLVASAPASVAGPAAIDAVTHAVESSVTTRRNPISRMYALEAWRLLEGSVEAALANPTDAARWAPVLLGSHLAGAAIEQSMLGAAHACANPLTARYGTVHGTAVGVMLPYVIRFNSRDVAPLYADLANAGRSSVPVDRRVDMLLEAAHLSARLRDHGVEAEDLPALADAAERQWTAGFNPRPVGRNDLLELYEAAY